MTLIKNTGNDRVIDELRQALAPPASLALAAPAFSLFAFAKLRDLLEQLDICRVVLPEANGVDLGLTGSGNDRAFRNRLQVRWIARECAAWIAKKVELRVAPALLPQSILIVGKPDSEPQRVITGTCAFTTEGLGLTPGNQFSLIQCSERPEESAVLASWFTGLWNTLPASDQHKTAFLALDAHAQLQRELAVLRAKAKKEKQINRRVELNLEIKRLQATLGEVRERL